MTDHSAKISWLDSGEPFSEQFQDFYFSTDGGLQETEYVFLKHNGFPRHFRELSRHSDTAVLRIGETGFGTGLNFLVTAYHWLRSTSNKCRLEYLSVEKYPLDQSQLEQVYRVFKQTWPQLSAVCDEFLDHYPVSNTLSGQHTFSLFNQQITLRLIIDDACSGLKKYLAEQPDKMDAWYLDGFAPAKNPDMWQAELFTSLAQLSQSGTRISTFTSAGMVRRGLTDAGFRMSKAPGLGKKREILYGVKA